MTEFTVVYGAEELVVGPAGIADDGPSDPSGGFGLGPGADDGGGPSGPIRGSDRAPDRRSDDGEGRTDSDDPDPDSDGPDAILERYEDGAVAIEHGDVVAVGPSDEVTAAFPPADAAREIDASGRAVVPGFVDPHTHALFAGDRTDEFAARLRGEDYQEILAEGGGILRTVRAVREASEDELLEGLLDRLDEALAHGTTRMEVKSGYGLDRETELKMLDVIGRADDRHPVDLVPTFMGAHAVPKGEDADAYADHVIDEQLPAVAEQGIASFCDVFCEADVFSVEQARRVLEAGREHGLAPKIHADEFTRLGGAELAADLSATSADHLLHATGKDARALADANVVPTLLPAAAFSLREPYADPEPFLESGAPVALGTDFNPNCHSLSVPTTLALACLGMGMAPARALLGATRNAALALTPGRSDPEAVSPVPRGAGTLRVGAPGDLLVLDAPSHVHLPYRFGHNPVDEVVKNGQLVSESVGGVRR